MDTNSRLAKMLDQEEAYETKKHCCLRPIIEYFGISVAFCYYSLLGRVIDFPSRVRVVKKIPSTGRVASTRHSLAMEENHLVYILNIPEEQISKMLTQTLCVSLRYAPQQCCS